jgi:hypothetical protein
MKKNKLSTEDARAIDVLRDRILLSLDFFEREQPSRSADDIRGIVSAAVDRGDLRGLRLIARDIEKAAIGLPADARDGLEAVLLERLGIDRNAERDQLRCEVAQAIEHGAPRSEAERRRLEDYAAMLEAEGGDPEEIAAVRRLTSLG